VTSPFRSFVYIMSKYINTNARFSAACCPMRNAFICVSSLHESIRTTYACIFIGYITYGKQPANYTDDPHVIFQNGLLSTQSIGQPSLRPLIPPPSITAYRSRNDDTSRADIGLISSDVRQSASPSIRTSSPRLDCPPNERRRLATCNRNALAHARA
jgi:hypothetical protein